MRLKLTATFADGRARCLMGYREQCPGEGRWAAGGYFVMCDADARMSPRPRRLTEREARDMAVEMVEAKKKLTGNWEVD